MVTYLVMDEHAGVLGTVTPTPEMGMVETAAKLLEVEARYHSWGETSFPAPTNLPETVEVGQVYRDQLGTPWYVRGPGVSPEQFALKCAYTRSLYVPAWQLRSGEYTYDPDLSR